MTIPGRTQHDLDAGGLPASGDTVPRPMSVADDESIVRESLLSWQCNGRPAAFERLVGAARDPVADIAARILRRSGVRDPAAVEDAVALVLDHLRRLPGVAFGERSVAPFEPVRAQSRPGLAYLTRLAVDRARDVVRQRRRCARRCINMPWIELVVDDTTAGDAPDDDERTRLHRAIATLPPRERAVMGHLLEGRTQAAIAACMRVCEGTVSRLRSRAVDRLRTLLAD
jgi:RNA polymerase sigma factor (sigma-70 family)